MSQLKPKEEKICSRHTMSLVQNMHKLYIKKLNHARISSFKKTLTFGTDLVVNVSLFLFLVFKGGESVRSTTESLLLSLSDHMIFSGNFY